MQNYTIFRQDRTLGIKKGGVMIYIRKDLALNTIELTGGSRGNCEYQIIHLTDSNLVLINMYRPPNAKLDDFKAQMEEINRVIDDIGNPLPTLILTGDFNFPELRWPEDKIGRISKATPLLECMNKYALENYIKEPTHEKNILDLFLTNDDEMVRDVRIDETNLSDHRILKITSCLNINPRQKRFTRRKTCSINSVFTIQK